MFGCLARRQVVLGLGKGCGLRPPRRLSQEFDSTPTLDTLLLLPSGISVSGIRSWAEKLAELKNGTPYGSDGEEAQAEIRQLEGFIAANSRQAEQAITERFRERVDGDRAGG